MKLLTLGISIGFFITVSLFEIDPGLVTENYMFVLGFSFMWIAIVMEMIEKLTKQ